MNKMTRDWIARRNTSITQFAKILATQTLLLVLLSCGDQHLDNESDYFDKCRELVLSENKIGQEHIFKIVQESFSELHVTYLGRITMKNDNILNVINQVYYHGLYYDSPHAMGRVYIYDEKHTQLGIYNVGCAWCMPIRVNGSSLIFAYDNEDCNETTEIDFSDSIPQEIFVKCKGDYGDIYDLSNVD